MRLSRMVMFHNQQLDTVASEVVILGTDRGTAKQNITASDRLGGYGQRITGNHWQTLEATVTFGIDVPKSKPQRRAQVYEAVRAWACGTNGTGRPDNPWLVMNYSGRKATVTIVGGIGNTSTANTTDNFKNQRLYVDQVVFPGVGDLFDWTKEYTITFRAYSVPFWQGNTAVSADTEGSEKNVTINVPGNMNAPVNANFINRSGKTIDNITIWTDISKITLASLGFGTGKELVISHSDEGLLSIKIGNNSVYDKYSGDDDLLIRPGSNKVFYKADRSVGFSAEAFGRYL